MSGTESSGIATAIWLYVVEGATPEEQVERVNEIQAMLAEANPIKHPVCNTKWLPLGAVTPNDYNPNSVANREMGLLHLSIQKDGYTQPIVTAPRDDAKPGQPTNEIVDGFHRYFTCRNNEDISDSTLGHLPVVEISTELGDRMEATVRHNRARGRHSVEGMSSMVFQLLDEGYTEAEVCDRLGMEAAEVARLTHITGFSKLMKDREYSRAMVHKKGVLKAKEEGHPVL